MQYQSYPEFWEIADTFMVMFVIAVGKQLWAVAQQEPPHLEAKAWLG